MSALLLIAVLGQYAPTVTHDVPSAWEHDIEVPSIYMHPGDSLMESCAGHPRGLIWCTAREVPEPPSEPWWKPVLVGLHVLFAFAVAMLGTAAFARFLRIVGAIWDAMKQ